MDDTRLNSLFDAYLETRQRGEDVTVDEVCRDAPELAESLRARLALLDALFGSWQKAKDKGQSLSPEQLCRESPELAPHLRKRIERELDDPAPQSTPFLGLPPSRPPGAEPVVGELLGSFRLRKELGRGGFGLVFLAVDEKLGREVALKVMQSEVGGEEFRQRFLREAQAMAKLRHPNVIDVYQVGEDNGTPFFVMPLLRGETLHERLEREGKLPIAEVIRIGRQVALGLAHAHEHRLIHRDVKPGNVWLEEGTGLVKVLDFGLARVPVDGSPSLSVLGSPGGTPGFMAPEQEAGWAVDHRCDQYSLGCVLYKLCTNRLPRGRFPAPSEVERTVPAWLSELIMRLLAYEASDRFADMREVATLLGRDGPPSHRPRPLPATDQLPPRKARATLPPGSIVNSVGMAFVPIPAGTFLMGSPPDEIGRDSNERQREVEIARSFYLGVFPVTQRQWQTVMGNNPAYFSASGIGKAKVKGLDTGVFPVERVSLEDAWEFIKKLNALDEERAKGRRYRLPTEEEWEYACRAGGKGPFTLARPTTALSSRHANFNGEQLQDGGPYLGRTCAVGSYEANPFGLFDVHGNVFEWCVDRYVEETGGEDRGVQHVIRGGSWGNHAEGCRSACRSGSAPTTRSPQIGFRAALIATAEEVSATAVVPLPATWTAASVPIVAAQVDEPAPAWTHATEDWLLPRPFPAYLGDEPFVFVSYAHSDQELVFPEIARLRELGCRIWYDEGIKPGGEWPEEIAAALKKCSYFLVFLSNNAVASQWVPKEINLAVKWTKGFVAVHLEETKLTSGLLLQIDTLQAILRHRLSDRDYHRKLEQALPRHLFGDK